MWKRICCAIDLSPRSDAVVRAAAELARATGADLLIVTLEEQAEADALYSQPEVRAAKHRERAYALEERRRAAADLRGGPVEAALIADHDVARRLAAYVVQSACDLLVVGARHEPHHSPFESVAEKLVRKASCSVLVVRASTGGAP